MRIMFGTFKFGKTVYAYMTRVYLSNHQVCDPNGDPVIYADIEASIPNAFDILYEKILRQGRDKGYDVNNICWVNAETGKEVKSYDHVERSKGRMM